MPERRFTTGSPRQLRDRLIGLAGTPDDSPTVATDLIIVTQLVADRLGAVRYASITRGLPGSHATVAASSELAVAVDQAQYADDAGPCLDSLADGRPVAVPEIAATMVWPRFRAVAAELGLRASLSIPLFAGSGATLASLNLYTDRSERLTALAEAVRSIYDGAPARCDLDAGGSELIAGLSGALAVRAVIQRALGVLMAVEGGGPQEAYLTLCERAVDARVPLIDMAADLTSGQR
jgi:hypothetical protein